MKGRRRFLRMYKHGLGGVILYEIPHDWTVDSVLDMGAVEDLFDGIGVRVSFVPLYACTSFVVSFFSGMKICYNSNTLYYD